MKTLDQVRRQNLDALIKERFEGNRAAFCRATGKHPNLINLVLTKNPDYQRNIGEKLCRSVEEALSLPFGYLDQPAHGKEGAGLATINILDPERDTEWLTIDRASLREISPTTSTGSLVVVRVKSDSMAPTVSIGDLVFIDQSESGKKVDTSGSIYVVNHKSGGHVLVRFRNQLGDWHLSFDNPAYPGNPVTQAYINKQDILGKVVSALTIKKF